MDDPKGKPARTLKEKVEWFFRNLQLQLEDLDFEQRHRERDGGKSLHFYFDTADVRGAVVGMHAFYSEAGHFLSRQFEDERALVHCLAGSRWLGEIRMLPPHEREFLSLLKDSFKVSDDRDPKGSARRFLRDVRALNEAAGAAAAPLEELSEEKLVEFVSRHAGSAVTAFKFIQSIRGTWQTRLVKWNQNRTLVIEREKVRYDEILGSGTYERLLKAFDDIRGDRHVNNKADAVAVMMLAQMVQDYNDGPGPILPRFFASTSLFHDAVEAAGMSDRLSYTGLDGEKVSVLRDADYFRFRATFQPPDDAAPAGDSQAHFFKDQNNLRQLRDQIASILRARAPLNEGGVELAEADAAGFQELVDQITVQDRRLSVVIDELENFSFLESVWVPFSAATDVQQALAALGEAADRLNEEKFQQGVNDAIRATKDKLEESTKEYVRVSALWDELQQAVTSLQARLSERPGRGLDLFRDLGLLRFDFPPEAQESTGCLLESLLSSNPRKERGAVRSIVSAFYIRRPTTGEQVTKLIEAAAALWGVRLYSKVVELLHGPASRGAWPHHSLQMLYAAAVLEIWEDDDRLADAERVIDDFERRFRETTDPERLAHLAVALGYLKFHLWTRRRFSASWRPYILDDAAAGGDGGQELIDQAIDYARRAFELLPARERKKKLYALNQYLFYLVEGGADDRRDEMLKAANLLLLQSQQQDVWQYRFNDTIARYYHRQALAARTEEEWQNSFRMAVSHGDEALRGSLGDGAVDRYIEIIRNDMSRGFQPAEPSAEQAAEPAPRQAGEPTAPAP